MRVAISPHQISTPRGMVVHVPTANGDMTAELKWNPGFGQAYTRKFGKVQIFIDETVVKGMDPYTPLKTSMMIKSALLGTVFGSGKIQYLAPYAKRQYYKGSIPGTASMGSRRGRLWFARWKAEKKGSLIADVRGFMRTENG